MENKRKIEDITDAEIETIIRLEDFKIGKIYIISGAIALLLGYLLYDLYGAVLAIIFVSSIKFIAIPIFTRVSQSLAKKHDPDTYKDMIEWRKRDYYKKFYEN